MMHEQAESKETKGKKRLMDDQAERTKGKKRKLDDPAERIDMNNERSRRTKV